MTDEDIVAALAEVLRAARGSREDDEGVWSYPLTLLPNELAAALLPVVRRVAEQRAAEELLAAAGNPDTHHVYGGSSVSVARLRARAAALTATPNHGTDET